MNLLIQGDFCYLPHYCSCPNHESMRLEKRYIIKYEKSGYPKFINHHNRKGIIVSEEARKNMCIAQKISKSTPESRKINSESHIGIQAGNKHPMFGKHHTPETIELIRQARFNQECPTLGKHWKMSEQWKKEMSDRMKGSGNPMFDVHMCKDLHWNWQGGKSFEPYCFKFDDDFKEQVRLRDNHTCQLCGKTEFENCEKLCVHHIHGDKANCFPDCISLCRYCNMHEVEKKDKKKFYENLFMNNLNERCLLFWSKRRLSE